MRKKKVVKENIKELVVYNSCEVHLELEVELPDQTRKLRQIEQTFIPSFFSDGTLPDDDVLIDLILEDVSERKGWDKSKIQILNKSFNKA